jgi:ABC-type uncharacterized transport system fused permease/ATPase subunit
VTGEYIFTFIATALSKPLKNTTMEAIFTTAIIVAIIIAIIKSGNNKARKLQELKLAYEQSLKGNNKKTALDAGRAYYSALRENKALTIYDEQAITNDLSTMVDQPVNSQLWNSPQL